VSFSTAGSYVMRLTASDSALSSSSDVVISIVNSLASNQFPTVNAGPDQTITLPQAASLSGSAIDDGLPNGTLTTTWSKVSGPGSVTYSIANALATPASFTVSGTYTLRLTASDGAVSTSADISIKVDPAPQNNHAPVVDAGPEQTITVFYVDPDSPSS